MHNVSQYDCNVVYLCTRTRFSNQTAPQRPRWSTTNTKNHCARNDIFPHADDNNLSANLSCLSSPQQRPSSREPVWLARIVRMSISTCRHSCLHPYLWFGIRAFDQDDADNQPGPLTNGILALHNENVKYQAAAQYYGAAFAYLAKKYLPNYTYIHMHLIQRPSYHAWIIVPCVTHTYIHLYKHTHARTPCYTKYIVVAFTYAYAC